MAADTPHQLPAIVSEHVDQPFALGEGGTEPDQGLRDLRLANTTMAVALGLKVGQAAILDVLGLGPRVLGERKR